MLTKMKFVFFISLLVGFASCKQNSKDQPITENISIDSLQNDSILAEESAWKNAPAATPAPSLSVHALALADSAKNAWKDLINLDNQKFKAINFIIKEFQQIKGINKSLLDSVDVLTKQAIAKHYTETNVNNDMVVNDYDKIIEVLMDKMDRLETTNKYFNKCRKCMDVFEEIRQTDARDLGQRIHFISAARDLNELLENEKEAISRLSEKHKQIKSVLSFSK
jgi:hypothetical protein